MPTWSVTSFTGCHLLIVWLVGEDSHSHFAIEIFPCVVIQILETIFHGVKCGHWFICWELPSWCHSGKRKGRWEVFRSQRVPLHGWINGGRKKFLGYLPGATWKHRRLSHLDLQSPRLQNYEKINFLSI